MSTCAPLLPPAMTRIGNRLLGTARTRNTLMVNIPSKRLLTSLLRTRPLEMRRRQFPHLSTPGERSLSAQGSASDQDCISLTARQGCYLYVSHEPEAPGACGRETCLLRIRSHSSRIRDACPESVLFRRPRN